MTDYYKQGRQDYHSFMTSKHFTYADKDVSAEVAMKLFLPIVPNEVALQITTPYPKDYREWLRGFNEAREEDEHGKKD